jgi:hypothetical protein
MEESKFTAEVECVNDQYYVGVTTSDKEVVFISRPFDERRDAEEMANAINEGRAKINIESSTMN